MILKSVTMQGFKSFANRTKIELDESVTAIVGPNGSGKSNITDAITWVLGETSVKNLRGSKMEDVIFSGTDSKKPLGMAEVTITFDNSDKSLKLPYNEVSVTRRMYRSLESEFLINNKKCRLKDIKELFMDTGIGKDGYSIIGQGKIETILSSKPEDRRAIFEEAAGISKYKYKKIESKNKLIKTEDNLIRIEDILSEIDAQEENLRIQAEKAKKYLIDYEVLKKYDINYSYKDIKKQKEEIHTLKERASEIESKSTENNLKRSSLSEKIKDIKEKIICIKDEIEKSKEKLNNSKSDYDNLKLKLTINKEQLNSINNEIKSLEKINIEISEEINLNKDELKNLKNSTEKLIDEKNKINESLSSKNSEIMDLENLFNKLKEIGDKSFEDTNTLNNEIENLKFKNETLRDIIKDKENRRENLSKNIDNFSNNDKEFINLISKTKDSLEITKNNISRIEESINNSNKDLNNKNSKLENFYSSLQNKNQEYNEIESRLKILNNMESNYEGYNRTIKSFMNYVSKNNLFSNSLFGPVGEKFTVVKKYEKAISVALGSMSQNIIVKSTKDTRDMLNLLEKNKMGRATFLPLDRVRGNKVKIQVNNEGIIGVACDLIEYENIFEPIFHNLLGRVLIVDNFKNASKISKKHNLKVVTLNGEIFNPSGAITGGSLNSYNSSFILRKNEINSLKNTKDNLKNNILELQKDYNREMDITDSLKKEILSLENTQSELKEKFNNTEANLSKNIQNQKLNTEYLSKYKKEKEDLEKSIKLDYENLTNNENVILSKEEDLEIIKNDLENGEKIREVSSKLEILKSEKLDIQLLDRENREKLNFANREVERLENSISLSDSKLNKNTLNLENLQKLLLEKKEFKEESQIKISELKNIIKEESNIVSTLDEKYIENNESLEEYKNSLIKINENILILSNEKEKILLKIEMKENSISNSTTRVLEDYNVENLEDYLDPELQDISENKVKKYRKIIKNYGEVNISSIEEYKVVSERLNFYKQQRDDLTKSKEEIKSIINKLDNEMKKIFNEAIDEISSNFQEIFKKLFNGGRAEISLEGDILNSGIEIKASPPGKRLQSLSLLSGGERSLTAVALLFAFLQYRPASFCILDEIDAALDDANIKRYANYLLTLDDIQFIIITHRKLTMEIAKSMYGVTMEEKGISKLYSVKLEN